MRETRAGHKKPVHRLLAVTLPISEMLPRDFDDVEGEEQRQRSWVERGHVLTVDIPRNS